MADLTWFIFGLGVFTGAVLSAVPVIFLVRNWNRKGKVWAFVQFPEGNEKHYLRRPDKQTHMIEVKGKSFLTGGNRNFFYAGKLDHERPAFRYYWADPRPVAYDITRVPEMNIEERDGKPTGNLIPTGKVAEIVNPIPAGPPPGALYTALHTKIFQDTYGGSDMWKLVVLAALGIVIVLLFGLYAK